jgi:4'-phosphopantetheinyl transferase EntD
MESLFTNTESHYKVTFNRGELSFLAMLSVIAKPFDQSLVSVLTPAELKIAANYTGTRYNEFVHSRYIAKKAVQQLMPEIPMGNIQVLKGVFEQPVLEVSNCSAVYDVSVSHKDTIAAALVFPQSHPAGIDIDVAVPSNIAALDRMLTPHERQLGQPKMIIYTAKEALSKVMRCGLTAPLHFLEVNSLQKEEIFYRGVFTNIPQYQFISFATEAYIITIVFPKNSTYTIEPLFL